MVSKVRSSGKSGNDRTNNETNRSRINGKPCRCAGGVDKPEDVNATLIRGIRVRFLPETRYRGAGKGRVSTRGLSDVDIEWEE